jgi:hypothetical protein
MQNIVLSNEYFFNVISQQAVKINYQAQCKVFQQEILDNSGSQNKNYLDLL